MWLALNREIQTDTHTQINTHAHTQHTHMQDTHNIIHIVIIRHYIVVNKLNSFLWLRNFLVICSHENVQNPQTDTMNTIDHSIRIVYKYVYGD